jgi:ketol-acid reductoisomerase
MFFRQAPECVPADVFTEMPGKFRRTGVRSAWADANRGGAAMFKSTRRREREHKLTETGRSLRKMMKWIESKEV